MYEETTTGSFKVLWYCLLFIAGVGRLWSVVFQNTIIFAPLFEINNTY